MNASELIEMGMPVHLMTEAFGIFKSLSNQHRTEQITEIRSVIGRPLAYVAHPDWGSLARKLSSEKAKPGIVPTIIGTDIDPKAIMQLEDACKIPGVAYAALMPDAHVGYGVPIGSVLATDNLVSPAAVGVDIACRMRVSVLDIPADRLNTDKSTFIDTLNANTFFGLGVEADNNHVVMDDPTWNLIPLMRRLKDTAHKQLGTSGGGNHFVEFGVLTGLDHPAVKSDRAYVALMSHSGSRGTGSEVCKYYSRLAKAQLPVEYEELKHLAWLSLDSGDGMEYWNAMELMGRYAAANHEIIHQRVIRSLGATCLLTVENHHNWAWKEKINGQTLIVHRKGATPAGQGVLGVIPGDMMNSGFLVRGKGSPKGLYSASHGAGRAMSRTAAKEKFSWEEWTRVLTNNGVHIISAGLDEVPGAYKDIYQVMASQAELVEPIAEFKPKIVRMSGTGESED